MAGLRPARSLKEKGTQSWQFDAVTVDQGLRQGGHNGVYGFLGGLSVHVVFSARSATKAALVMVVMVFSVHFVGYCSKT